MIRILMLNLKQKLMSGKPDSLPGRPGFLQERFRYIVVAGIAVTGLVAALAAFVPQSSIEYVDLATDLDRPCAPWEIYDPEMEAAQMGGGGVHAFMQVGEPDRYSGPAMPGSSGVTSSGPGCFAPCYLTLNDVGDGRLDMVIMADETNVLANDNKSMELRESPMVQTMGSYPLIFNTSNRPPIAGNGQRGEVRVGVTYNREKTTNPDVTQTDIEQRHSWLIRQANTDYVWSTDIALDPSYLPVRAVGTHVPPTDKDYTIAIMVTPEQDGCVIYHTVTGQIYLDSRKA